MSATLESLADLAGLADALVEELRQADFGPAVRKALADLEDDHARFFASETAPDGSPWPPLAESTARRKGHWIKLVETGALMASLVSTNGDSVRFVFDEQLTKGFAFGTRDEKSPFHQFGTARIPRREHVGFTDARVDQIAEDLADHAAAVLAGVV